MIRSGQTNDGTTLRGEWSDRSWSTAMNWQTTTFALLFLSFTVHTAGFSLQSLQRQCYTTKVLPDRKRRSIASGDLLLFNNKMASHQAIRMSAASPSSQPSKVGWEGRLQQLRDFKRAHGHTRVRRNNVDPPGLGNWVSKQRQMYKRYQTGLRPCSLNEERIAKLEDLEFCWDGRKEAEEESNSMQITTWWNSLDEFRALRPTDKGKAEIPMASSLGKWLRQQRISLLRGRLTEEQQAALNEIDSEWWMTRQQRAWEQHFETLRAYAAKNGHCCVPITDSNQQLANFVANQRKQYNLRKKQRASSMSDERIKRLESIGFVWNRWDYEFEKSGAFLDHTTSTKINEK